MQGSGGDNSARRRRLQRETVADAALIRDSAQTQNQILGTLGWQPVSWCGWGLGLAKGWKQGPRVHYSTWRFAGLGCKRLVDSAATVQSVGGLAPPPRKTWI